MKKAKDILTQLAAGHGGIFSDEIRAALEQGAAALEFKFKVLAALNDTANAAPAGEPAPAAHASVEQRATQQPSARQETAATPAATPPAHQPRGWSPAEDQALVQEFDVECLPVDVIAERHGRSARAIVLRLQNKHGLLTQAQADSLLSLAGRSASGQSAERPESASAHKPPVTQQPSAAASRGQPAEQASGAPRAEVRAQPAAESLELPDPPLAGSDFDFTPEGFSIDGAGQVHQDEPDYATLYEMELDRAQPEEKQYANQVLDNFKQSAEISRRNNIIRYVTTSKGKMNETLKNALLGKLNQLASAQMN